MFRAKREDRKDIGNCGWLGVLQLPQMEESGEGVDGTYKHNRHEREHEYDPPLTSRVLRLSARVDGLGEIRVFLPQIQQMIDGVVGGL